MAPTTFMPVGYGDGDGYGYGYGDGYGYGYGYGTVSNALGLIGLRSATAGDSHDQ